MVEHDLAKVGVASSSLVFRSKRLAVLRGVFVMSWLVCAARLVYMSRLYRQSSAERLSLVQVSWIKPIIRPIPEDLSIKPRPETHFGAQARLVHRVIDSAGQIHLEETGIALIPGVDEYSFFFSAD